ncbi:hypothetical protein GCM10017562_70850 [Streptomyces roseofulvus]
MHRGSQTWVFLPDTRGKVADTETRRSGTARALPGWYVTSSSPAVSDSSCPLAINKTDPTMDEVQVKNNAKVGLPGPGDASPYAPVLAEEEQVGPHE